MSTEIIGFAVVAAFVFGACIGSFLNVIIWRLPRQQTLSGRSQCPHCHHSLKWYDLIPLFSFLFSAARCRYCKKPVSYRYPLIETITGFLFAAAMYHVQPHDLVTWLILLSLVFTTSICIAVFVIDLEHYLILDKIVYPAMVLSFVLALAISIVSGSAQPAVSSLLCALGAFIPFWLIWYIAKGKWMGYGDVKFVAWLGFALAWPGIAVALFISFTVGAIVGIFLIVFGKKQLSSKLPFGTFLSIAAILAAFYAPQLWGLYWGIFQP